MSIIALTSSIQLNTDLSGIEMENFEMKMMLNWHLSTDSINL